MPDGSSNRSKPKAKRTTVDRLAAKHAKERHLGILERAYRDAGWGPASADVALDAYGEVRAVIKAITPGLQKSANIAGLLDKGVKAAARTIRRRGKQR